MNQVFSLAIFYILSRQLSKESFGAFNWSLPFDPLDPDRAAGQWRALWNAWRAGMRAALPVDIDAAGAWLRAGADPEPGGKAWRAAEETYLKRVADDLYLRRSYPDFDRLCAGGGFFHWAQVLYGEVSRAIRSYPAAAEGGA